MRKLVTAAALLLLASGSVHAADGLVTLKSTHDVKTTLDRLESGLKEKGMTIFARIDHAGGARKIGKELRPTTLLIFGNPQGGTPLMTCAQTAGIDLPLKALAWQDKDGRVWLGYNDPAWLATRHQLGSDCAKPIEAIGTALRNFMTAAAGP